MSQEFSTEGLQALATFPFEDTDWKRKFTIGSLITLAGFIIPVVPLLVIYGYAIKIMREIILENKAPFLPDWDDWGQYLKDGFKLLGVGILYLLPMYLAMIVGGLLIFGSISLIPVDSEAASVVIPIVGGIGGVTLFAIIMIFSLGLGIYLPVVIAHVIAKDSFRAAFDYKACWALFRANLSGFLLTYVIILAFSLLLNLGLQIVMMTIIGCCFLPFLMPAVILYLTIIQGVLYAQAYSHAVIALDNSSTEIPPVEEMTEAK
ncbi:MAG: DUF4013 domain-containing protein [Chloroflexota bacterium]